jgi:hypothetical protein
MSEDQETPPPPVEETRPEILAEQLEKAADKWASKADSETQAADGDVAKQILYQATADAMRHAKKSIEEKLSIETTDSERNET